MMIRNSAFYSNELNHYHEYVAVEKQQLMLEFELIQREAEHKMSAAEERFQERVTVAGEKLKRLKEE